MDRYEISSDYFGGPMVLEDRQAGYELVMILSSGVTVADILREIEAYEQSW